MAAVDGAPWESLMPQAAAALKEMQKLMDAGVFARPLPEISLY
jgi:predicted AlkP superfamily phosphohydrolase/phosphomutase